MEQLDIPNDSAPAPWHWDPLTRQRSNVVGVGDSRAPEFGPGYELTGESPRPAQHDITYGFRDEGNWIADSMTGVHGAVGTLEADHYGYQEAWDVNMPIERSAPAGSWDEGMALSGSSGGWV